MDPRPSDLILTCKLWVSQNKLASLIRTRAECEAAVRRAPANLVFRWNAQLASHRQVSRAHLLRSQTYIQRCMEVALDSPRAGRRINVPEVRSAQTRCLSVASPTRNVLIAVINAPWQHLAAVWAINKRVCQWRSVLFCGRQDTAHGDPWTCSPSERRIQTLLGVSDATARDAVFTGCGEGSAEPGTVYLWPVVR